MSNETLTPEERRRVFLQEKTRMEEALKKKSFKISPIGIIFLVIMALAAIGIIDDTFKNNKQETKYYSRLSATARVNGAALEIKNENIYDWTPKSTSAGRGIKLIINDTFTALKKTPVKAGETIYVAFGHFTRKDGTRFNQNYMTVKSLGIICKEESGFITF